LLWSRLRYPGLLQRLTGLFYFGHGVRLRPSVTGRKGSAFTTLYCKVFVGRMIAAGILYEGDMGLFSVLGNAAFRESLTSGVYLLPYSGALE
jgi:hypothetical protein